MSYFTDNKVSNWVGDDYLNFNLNRHLVYLQLGISDFLQISREVEIPPQVFSYISSKFESHLSLRIQDMDDDLLFYLNLLMSKISFNHRDRDSPSFGGTISSDIWAFVSLLELYKRDL